MKITFPILTLSLGGAQRMLSELTNGLVESGHDVTILLPQNAPINYILKAKVVRVQGFFPSSDDFPQSDIILSNFHTTVEAAELASQQGRGIHVRLSLCYEPPFLPDNNTALATYHVTPHIIVLSTWQQQLIRLMHGIQAHVVPIGVSSTFRNLQIRHQLGRSLHVTAGLRKPEGGFSSHREQAYLLSELRAIKAKFPTVHLDVFCPQAELFESPFLQEIYHSGTFRFLTPANDDELCYHYNEADIFVSSCSYDAGSMPGLEAMRCGAALVAINSGGNTDYCKDGHNSLLSFRFQERLAKDIAHLIACPQKRERLARAGERETMRWTWRRSVSELEIVLRKILKP